jgi:hypothetical protein
MSRMSALTTLRLMGSPTKPGWPYCAPCVVCAVCEGLAGGGVGRVWAGFEPAAAAASAGRTSSTSWLPSSRERSRAGARKLTCRLKTGSAPRSSRETLTDSTSGEVTP